MCCREKRAGVVLAIMLVQLMLAQCHCVKWKTYILIMFSRSWEKAHSIIACRGLQIFRNSILWCMMCARADMLVMFTLLLCGEFATCLIVIMLSCSWNCWLAVLRGAIDAVVVDSMHYRWLASMLFAKPKNAQPSKCEPSFSWKCFPYLKLQQYDLTRFKYATLHAFL